MATHEPADALAEERRQEIFRALAVAQDEQEMTVPQSRRLIAQRFGVSEAQLRQIEHEGRERLWATV
jgi:hypothetical protein